METTSRHLEGIVFHCHKCTFTCSSEQNLQQHLEKHEELKPYQCQLCYYDSKLLHELEIHLRDEHKVIRNFELMGRVNLDQLELLKEKMRETSGSEEEEREEAENMEEEEEELVDEKEEEKVTESQQEEPTDRSNVTGVLESPGSSSSVKRYPCEFCGRTFTLDTEWERHVLRHGMTVNGSKKESGPLPSTGSSTLIGPASVIDRGLDLSSNTVDPVRAVQSDRSKIQNEEMLETKNDP